VLAGVPAHMVRAQPDPVYRERDPPGRCAATTKSFKSAGFRFVN
jgi:hypothetical protein